MYKLPLNFFGKRLSVALIGAGGSGSAIFNELIRLDTTLNALDTQSGLDVTVFDGSNVSHANITRQTFFVSQIGSNKADALVWSSNNLHGKQWQAVPKHFIADQKTLEKYDIIITALDRPSVRYEISKAASMYSKTLWLDMGNDATEGQVVLGELKRSASKELPHICDLYDYSQLSDKDALIKSCSAEESISRQELGVNQFAARIGAQVLWNALRHGSIESHGAMFNAKTLEVTPIHCDPNTWALYGYKPQETTVGSQLAELAEA
jgi:PRTRC genetic system ThiF family protein